MESFPNSDDFLEKNKLFCESLLAGPSCEAVQEKPAGEWLITVFEASSRQLPASSPRFWKCIIYTFPRIGMQVVIPLLMIARVLKVDPHGFYKVGPPAYN